MTDWISTLASPLNIVFLAFQLFVFTRAVLPAGPGDAGQRRRQSQAPDTLTSLGILGTFVGILVGLLGFDVSNIEASVPRLLKGMTTAFFTSVVGLTFAIVLRALYRLPKYQAGGGNIGKVTSADLYRIIEQSGNRTAAELTALRTDLGSLVNAIGGEGDSTLISQVKLLRAEQRDASSNTIRALEDFANKVSKLGSEAMIAALSEVIRDFNMKLSEQFGDNFKQLNAAVESLVVWQEQYRIHIEQLEDRFASAQTGIAAVEVALTGIAEAITPLPDIQEQLSDALDAIAHQNRDLESRLVRFAELGDKAVAALPTIEANIARLTTEFTATLTGGLKQMGAANAEQQRVVRVVTDAYDTLRRQAEDTIVGQTASHDKLQKSFTQTLATLETTLREMHAQSARQWQETLKEQVERQQDAISQQLTRLDESLERELTQAVGTMSQHLLGLHQQLVQDYTPLLASLRNIVSSGRRPDTQ